MALVDAYSSKTGAKRSVPEEWVGKRFGATKWLKTPPANPTDLQPPEPETPAEEPAKTKSGGK